MKEDIYYTNLMIKLEKLEDKIERLEKILLSHPIELKTNFTIEKPITPEDFSSFLEFGENFRTNAN
jgi:hypothetical protein